MMAHAFACGNVKMQEEPPAGWVRSQTTIGNREQIEQ